jgi:hypothetical protein
MERRRWKDLPPEQRAAIVVAGCAQVALASAAWVDLARRPRALVRGPKAVWAVAIAVNVVGPIAYFTAGRRR